MNNNKWIMALLLMSTAVTFSGCEAIGGIFKAGMWVGVIIVVVVIILVLWLMNKMRK